MSFFAPVQQIQEVIQIDEWPADDFLPTYHQVAQSWHPFPVVFKNENKNKLAYFEWGLIASYMNTPEKIAEYRSSMANARSEKIIGDTRSIWHRIRHQRCLVCTTGFFEHRDIGAKKKLPYFIKVKDKTIFLLAGLYNYTTDTETGEMTGTFSIITRKGNELMEKIHNSGPNGGRMPLLLTETIANQWLDPNLTDEGLSEILSFALPSNQLEAWPVNTIRKRKEDSVGIIQSLPLETVPPL
ncbi:MAG: SOS response-associated peptidase [Bacteroidota bacterium]|jgi:putative SOS response-associated peptidase YedK